MKIIKKIITIIVLFPTLAFGNDANIKKLDKKYNVNFFISEYDYYYNDKTETGKSFSLLKNGCFLELNNTKSPILMKTKQKDFEYTFLHEISHCILGKEVFYYPVQWQIDISQKMKDKIEYNINENENFYLYNNRIPLIKVIYHEIFADTFATILYLRNNLKAEKDIHFLLNKRIHQNINPYDTHLSVSAIKRVIKEKKQIKSLTIGELKNKAIEIAQQELLQYMREEYE